VPCCAKIAAVQRLINGAAIRALRELLGIPQKDLAARAGISPSHMSKIESGAEVPRIETAARVATGLGVSLDVIAPVINAADPEPARA